jgi:galactokinase
VVVTAFAPGRVNLIGEHTDYNQGLSLPFAIEQGVTVTAQAQDGEEMHVIARDLDGHDAFPLGDPPPVRGWRAFARGIAAELQAFGRELRPARLEITGSVPRGSGLSSSAALEVALALAMLAVAECEPLDRMDLARLCSRAENEWVGAQTGLLDQIASLFGEAAQAIRVDFRSLEVQPVPLELGGFSLVTLDSGQRHSHSSSGPDSGEAGYNQRRAECRQATERLGVESLREADLDAAEHLPQPLGRRVRHVVTENRRVEQTVRALADGDLAAVGQLLDASHASLRDDYEVSTDAVEATVRRLHDAGAVAARIMGGGFGGYVLGLLPPDADLPEGAVSVAAGRGAHVHD